MEHTSFLMAQKLLMETVIAWAFTGATILAVLFTCLSLVGLVKFSDQQQQRRLFVVTLIPMVGIGISFFGGFINFDTKKVSAEFEQMTIYDYWHTFEQAGVVGQQKPGEFPSHYKYAINDVLGDFQYNSKLNVYTETNKRLSFPEYHYFFRPIRVEGDFLVVYDDYRAVSLMLPKNSGIAKFCGSGVAGDFTDIYPVTVVVP